MKKLLVLIMVLLVSASLFADVKGSATSTSVYDVDAETFTETVATSLTLGPVVLGNTFVFPLIGDPDFKWSTAITYALNDALTFGVVSGYGYDAAAAASEESIPLTLTAAWKSGGLSVSAKYANDNLNADEVETGTFTLVAGFSF